MANEGTYPLDPGTPEGLFRFEVGDVVGTPTTTGQGTYEFMSDDTILALIDTYPNSINTAKARAFQSMATQLIAAAQDIQVDDIRIKTIERANLMFNMAKVLGGNAILEDASTAFTVVALSPEQYRVPQGQPWPVGYPGQPGAIGESGF